MTTKTEQSRREMYTLLADTKLVVQDGRVPIHNLAGFESALEAHLEDLRQELIQARQSIDDLQIRNHALSYAYSALQVACRSSGDSLREAQELIGKQRQVIAGMHTAKAAPITCQHSYQYMHDVPSGELQPRCIFCRLLLEK